MVNEEILKTLIEDCERGNLDVHEVLHSTLVKLNQLDETAVLTMAAECGYIRPEDYGDETLLTIEEEIDRDEELTPQQRIIEKVLARYGDV